MRRILVVLLVLAILGLILLHTCPPFEFWLHQLTGWY